MYKFNKSDLKEDKSVLLLALKRTWPCQLISSILRRLLLSLWDVYGF